MEKLQLVLTNPCTRQWEDLQPEGTGRYCDNCDKHIVDLTGKTDAELLSFFKNKKENVCGRLYETQLHRALVVPTQRPGWHFMVPMAISAMAFAPAQAAQLSQVLVEQVGSGFQSAGFDADSLPKPINADTIKGTVVDQRSGLPVKGVKIRQTGFINVLAETDTAGKFMLVTGIDSQATTYTLECSGYTSMDIQLQKGINVKLQPALRLVLGGVRALPLNSDLFVVVSVGNKSCTMDAAKLKAVNPDWIEEIKVLNGVQAAALYGSKGKNGALLIEIKKKFSKNIDFSKKK